MSKSNLIIGRDLGLAICKHFGIDTAKHVVGSDFEIKAEPGTPVTVKLTLMLTADDLAGIARAAGADSANPYEGATEFYKGHPDVAAAFSGDASDNSTLTLKVDAKASEILRRYGIGGQAPDDSKMMDAINQLVEETRKMRECLYRIMKNTERSAWLAEDAAATSAASVQTVLRD